jgi:hypothetical protein
MGSFRPKAHAATPLGCSRIGLAAAFLIGTTIPLATRDRDAIAAVAAVRSATPKGTAGASYGLGFGATQFLGGRRRADFAAHRPCRVQTLTRLRVQTRRRSQSVFTLGTTWLISTRFWDFLSSFRN